MDKFLVLERSIRSVNPDVTNEEWQFLKAGCEVKCFENKEFFIRVGEYQKAIGYLNFGLLRGYYLDEKGEEVTTRFVAENGYATHYSALINGEPSRYFFKCLEPSEMVLLPLEVIRVGFDRYKGLERFGRLIAEHILTSQEKRIESFQFLSAEERYLLFIRQNPTLFNRVSLSHLSSYLGIQRPSLSRIRQKIAKG